MDHIAKDTLLLWSASSISYSSIRDSLVSNLALVGLEAVATRLSSGTGGNPQRRVRPKGFVQLHFLDFSSTCGSRPKRGQRGTDKQGFALNDGIDDLVRCRKGDANAFYNVDDVRNRFDSRC
jgi:hypothetical protein